MPLFRLPFLVWEIVVLRNPLSVRQKRLTSNVKHVQTQLEYCSIQGFLCSKTGIVFLVQAAFVWNNSPNSLPEAEPHPHMLLPLMEQGCRNILQCSWTANQSQPLAFARTLANPSQHLLTPTTCYRESGWWDQQAGSSRQTSFLFLPLKKSCPASEGSGRELTTSTELYQSWLHKIWGSPTWADDGEG